MRRPPYGVSVMRGLLLIWKKMTVNIEHGYVPSWWTPVDRQDADRAMRWLGMFIDWVEDRKVRAKDGDAEVDGEPVHDEASEPEPGAEEGVQTEGAEPGSPEAASANGHFDPEHFLAGAKQSRGERRADADPDADELRPDTPDSD